jgi:hypothetical protein
MNDMAFVARFYEYPHNPKAGKKYEGQYVKFFSHEAHGGRGEVDFTPDVDKALKFNSVLEFFEWYTRVPKNRPTREDGKPNRPATAMTLETVKVDGP